MQVERYHRYLAAIHARDWDAVAGHVAEQVRVNGRAVGRATYVGDLRALVDRHPDHRWRVAELLHDGDRLAVRLATSRSAVQGFELAHYEWSDDRIVAVWTVGTLPG